MDIFDYLNELLFYRHYKDFHNFILTDKSIKFSEKRKHLNKLLTIYSKNVKEYESNVEELKEDNRMKEFIIQADFDLQLEKERLANINIAIQNLNNAYKRATEYILTHDPKTTNTTRRPIGKYIGTTSKSRKIKKRSIQKKKSKRRSIQKTKRKSKRRSIQKKRSSKKRKSKRKSIQKKKKKS